MLELLELLLELADVFFAVGESLVAARELLELALDLELLRQNALLDLQHLRTPVRELRVDLAPQPHRLLASLDLRLASHGVALTARVVEQLVADPASLRDSRRAEDRHGQQGKGDASGDPDGDSDPDLHVPGSLVGDTAACGGAPFSAGPSRQLFREAVLRQAHACRTSLRYLARNLRVVGSEWSVIGCGFGKAAFAGKTSNGCVRIVSAFRPLAQTSIRLASSVSREKPRPASRRRSAGVTLFAREQRRGRVSSSGSRPATASAAASAPIRRRRRSARIAASP